MRSLLIGVFLLTACAAEAAPSRTTILVSDLHFGVGKDTGHQWDQFEDARWASDWSGFLSAIDDLGKSQVDLVLNGDTFELWQALPGQPCGDGTTVHGCDSRQAVVRLDHVMAQHDAELDALAAFATRGENAVVLVPGNHDAAILFPDVQQRLRDRLGPRVTIATDGYWLSTDRQIYAEHGHQILPEANSFDHWAKPFSIPPDRGYLESPWGERFVVDFYNPYERKYPAIDNITNELRAFSIARRAEGATGTAAGLRDLIAFLVTRLSARQFVQGLGPGDDTAQPPQWDIDDIMRDVSTPKGANDFIIACFPKDDPLWTDASRTASTDTPFVAPAQLTRERVQELCDVRAMLNAQQKRANRPITIEPCKAKKLGAITARLLDRSTKNRRDHFDKVHDDLVARVADSPMSVVVIGHTHVLEIEHRLFPRSRAGWTPTFLNSGAWQRTVTEQEMVEMAAHASPPKTVEQLLAMPLQPEQLPGCYGVVVVDPYDGTPIAHARYWKVDDAGHGSFVAPTDPGCPQG